MRESTDIAFKIQLELYSKYKNLLSEKPSTDLTNYIRRYVEAHSSMGFRLYQRNVHCKETNNYCLPDCTLTQSERMNAIADEIIVTSDKPELVFLTEMELKPYSGNIIIDRLHKENYQIYHAYGVAPEDEVKKSHANWCLPVLAVKEGITFEQEKRLFPVSTPYRIIVGNLVVNGIKFKLCGAHVPSVKDATNKRQIERKEGMMSLLKKYAKKSVENEESFIVCGDINTKPEENGLLSLLVNTCDEKTHTFLDITTIDYSLISPGFFEILSEATTMVIEDKSFLSDHFGLLSIFKITA